MIYSQKSSKRIIKLQQQGAVIGKREPGCDPVTVCVNRFVKHDVEVITVSGIVPEPGIQHSAYFTSHSAN